MNEEINKRIDEIEQLLTNDTYDDYLKAIDLMQKELARLEEERQKELKRIEDERQKEEAHIKKEKKIIAYVVFYISLVLIISGIAALYGNEHWFWGFLVIVGFLFYAIIGNITLYNWTPSVKETTWKNMTLNIRFKIIAGIIIAIVFLIFMCTVV